MVWCESPPLFCSGLETARDIISKKLPNNLPPHKFENIMRNECTAGENQDTPDTIINSLEIYVDDFIGMTNDLRADNVCHLLMATLHGIHSIFPPPSVTGHNGFGSIFEAKLATWDGTCYFKKYAEKK